MISLKAPWVIAITYLEYMLCPKTTPGSSQISSFRTSHFQLSLLSTSGLEASLRSSPLTIGSLSILFTISICCTPSQVGTDPFGVHFLRRPGLRPTETTKTLSQEPLQSLWSSLPTHPPSTILSRNSQTPIKAPGALSIMAPKMTISWLLIQEVRPVHQLLWTNTTCLCPMPTPSWTPA